MNVRGVDNDNDSTIPPQQPAVTATEEKEDDVKDGNYDDDHAEDDDEGGVDDNDSTLFHEEEEEEEDNDDQSDVDGGGGMLPELFQRQMLERGGRDDDDDLDPSMMITEQEREWALELQQVVRANAHCFAHGQQRGLPLISDMEFAQHAIIAQGNTQEALQRIIGQYNFFNEYQVDHTSQQIVYYLREFMRQQPGYLLHLDCNDVAQSQSTTTTQQGLLVIDAAAFSPRAALEASLENGADHNWKINAVGYYYMHYVVQPSLASIRQGILAMSECQGLGWHNFDMEYDSRLHAEMFGSLPVRYKAILAYNTSVVANLVFNLVKPIMPRSMREAIRLGCQVLDADGSTSTTRLSALYTQPSLEEAQERILRRAATLVATRFYNETVFRL